MYQTSVGKDRGHVDAADIVANDLPQLLWDRVMQFMADNSSSVRDGWPSTLCILFLVGRALHDFDHGGIEIDFSTNLYSRNRN